MKRSCKPLEARFRIEREGEVARLSPKGFFVCSQVSVSPPESIVLCLEAAGRKLNLRGTIVRRSEPTEPAGFFVLVDEPLREYHALYEELLVGGESSRADAPSARRTRRGKRARPAQV